jgi:hypothetical protein
MYLKIPRGHVAIKTGGAVNITRCVPVEVIPCSHKNCREEISIVLNGTEMFVDLISYVIKKCWVPGAL